MPRVEYRDGEVVSEAFSPDTRLHYTPRTRDGQVIFHPERHFKSGGRAQEQVLVLDLAECLDRNYTITLPDGSQQTHAGLIAMLIIQQAYHEHYEEREAAEAAAAEVEASDLAPQPALPAPESTDPESA